MTVKANATLLAHYEVGLPPSVCDKIDAALRLALGMEDVK